MARAVRSKLLSLREEDYVMDETLLTSTNIVKIERTSGHCVSNRLFFLYLVTYKNYTVICKNRIRNRFSRLSK